MRLPKYEIKTLIRVYYECPELSNRDIRAMFGEKIGYDKLRSLKKEAENKRIELGKPLFDARNVNTECAYIAWGLDISDLERRYMKLKKLGMSAEA